MNGSHFAESWSVGPWAPSSHDRETVPLKRAVRANVRSLPEDTNPNLEFQYIDISSVGPLGHLTFVDPIAFRDAPSRARRLMSPGDVLVSTVRTHLGAIARAPDEAATSACSTGFAVLTAREGLDPEFLYWLCRSSPFINEVVSRSNGVSYPAINPQELLSVAVLIPPLSEQRAIADFLDHEMARIDGLISRRAATLELLEEKERTLITDALLPSTAVRRSAAPWPWLGNLDPGIPLVALGRLATVQSGVTIDAGRERDQTWVRRPYLRVANVQDGWLDLEDVTEVEVPERLAERTELRAGDVLMTEGNGNPANLGRGVVWRGEVPNCLHQNHLFAIRPVPGALASEYLALLTQSLHGRHYFHATASQVGIATTSSSRVGKFPVPLRPVGEQEELVRKIRRRMAVVAASRRAITRQIALLKERRQALITAAVTGQLDLEKRSA